MNINTKPLSNQAPLPTGELWVALLVIFNHYLVEQLGLFRICREGDAIPEEVVAAVRLLDCWLDVAIENDWLASKDSLH